MEKDKLEEIRARVNNTDFTTDFEGFHWRQDVPWLLELVDKQQETIQQQWSALRAELKYGQELRQREERLQQRVRELKADNHV